MKFSQVTIVLTILNLTSVRYLDNNNQLDYTSYRLTVALANEKKMGNIMSNTVKDKAKVKLDSEKIRDFAGADDEWQKWKNRTLCAFSGTGYKEVITDKEYAHRHPDDNEIVFSRLSAATTDGIAYHLVQKFEDTRDGHAAWANLCEWYDGDTIQSETAENLRIKLENLTLHTGVQGADYVNKFSGWYRDLQKVPNEGYSKSHAVYLFLKNITDPDYKTTVTFCRNTNATLDDCITAVRKQERDLIQQRLERRRLRSVVRRMKLDNVDSDDDESLAPPTKRHKTTKTRRVQPKDRTSDNSKFEGELMTTERGLLRFQGECWRSMDPKDQEWVREYNASVKHGEMDKVKLPTGISIKRRVRRTQNNPTPDDDDETHGKHKKTVNKKGRKSISFGISDGMQANDDDE
jgi:hypothetical protein